MYKLYHLKYVTKSTNNFYGQEIPSAVYASKDEKVKNSDLKFKVRLLLDDKTVETICFRKYPLKDNKEIYVKHFNKMNEEWDSCL